MFRNTNVLPVEIVIELMSLSNYCTIIVLERGHDFLWQKQLNSSCTSFYFISWSLYLRMYSLFPSTSIARINNTLTLFMTTGSDRSKKLRLSYHQHASVLGCLRHRDWDMHRLHRTATDNGFIGNKASSIRKMHLHKWTCYNVNICTLLMCINNSWLCVGGGILSLKTSYY